MHILKKTAGNVKKEIIKRQKLFSKEIKGQ